MDDIHSSSQKTPSSDSLIQETSKNTAPPEQTMSVESGQPLSLNEEHTCTVSFEMEPAVQSEQNVTLVSEQATADQAVTQIGEQPVTETSGYVPRPVLYRVTQPM